MRRSNDPDPTHTAQPTDGIATTITSAVPPPPPQVAPVVPGTRLGRYELQEEIGRGGMGVVFRARDPALGRPLAIKVLHARATGARAQVRLLDEARAMAKLRHPSVLPVFDVGRVDGYLHVVTPYVSGGTLYEWLISARRPWRDVLDRFVAAGRGLAAAHAAGLVHRDFKPTNVLLDGDGSVLVSDFGIAAHLDADETGVGVAAKMSTVAGTPAYMAPEQARGDAIDARADQYSFCVSLWEGLHGERPQQGATHSLAGRFSPGDPALRAHHSIPDWLTEALVRGLAIDPAHRWPSLTALLDHIDQRRAAPANADIAPPRRHRAWLGVRVGVGALVLAFVLSLVAAGAAAVIVATRDKAQRAATPRAEPVAAPAPEVAADSAPAPLPTPSASDESAAEPSPSSSSSPSRKAAPTGAPRAKPANPADDDLSASRY